MGRSERVTGPLQAITPRAGRYRLLVLANNDVGAVHELPELGSVSLGRSADNDIQIDDESISRRHAVLHVGHALSIEDLGSSNGSKVGDVVLQKGEPHELGVNELLTLGSVTLIVQVRFAPAQIARVATQDYFQTRVEEECIRSERTGGRFSVVGIRATNESDSVIAEALMTTLRQSDVLARFDGNMYALLAIDATHEQAEQAARRMVTSLRRVGAEASYLVAQYPTDARSAYALLTQITGRVDEVDTRDALVIEEQSMRDLYALAKRIATSDLSVLILGETGVGKEKMSRTIHDSSGRAAKPFVAINCAALNDSLLESELFGHERGAFTGATTNKTGLLESGDGGTVFLDEIGDMSLAIQSKLLRVLEDGEVRRVGGVKSKTIDLRFVAATNVDLEAAVAAEKFRGDLYFRLSAATLVIPPLRERPREIDILARRFAAGAASRMGRTHIDFTNDALALLRSYSWPGNIRELRNVIERAVVLCDSDLISANELPVEKIRGTYTRNAQPSLLRGAVTFATGTKAPPNSSDGDDERTRILKALEEADGNQSKAASLLGVSRRTLINRLEQYNLPRPRKKRET